MDLTGLGLKERCLVEGSETDRAFVCPCVTLCDCEGGALCDCVDMSGERSASILSSVASSWGTGIPSSAFEKLSRLPSSLDDEICLVLDDLRDDKLESKVLVVASLSGLLVCLLAVGRFDRDR